MRIDLNARYVKWLLQADGAGVLKDHARNRLPVSVNDLAIDAGDPLYGVASFTGSPELRTPDASVLSQTFTLEAWIKLASSTSRQTLISAASGTYYIPCEFALDLLPNASQSFDLYNGIRGSSEAHAVATLAANFAIDAWVHLFLCVTPTTAWMGVNGQMTPSVGMGFTSDHLGARTLPLRLNNVDPALGSSPNTGKLHSVMATDGIIRYPYDTSGIYTAPDDLFTNWYQDPGAEFDPVLPNEAAYAVGRVAVGGRAFQNGDQKIAGHLTYSGANAQKRVALFHRASQAAIAQTYSRASDGYFEFPGLEPSSEYFVIGFDDTPGTINAEIADHLIPA